MDGPTIQVPLHRVKWGDVTLSIRVHSVVRDGNGRLVDCRDADFVESIEPAPDLQHMVVRIKAPAP